MKRFLKVSLLLTAMTLMLASCNCYQKMSKGVAGVEAVSIPEILTLKGNSVTADVKVDLPAKFVNKKAILRVTPVLVFEGGEIAGAPKFVQGTKVKDNYQVVGKKGGSYTQTVTFPYDKRADISTLELRFDVQCCAGGEFLTLASFPVAQGISNVLGLLDYNDGLTVMANNFKRVTTIQQDADVMYQVNSSAVRPKALNNEQIKLLEEFVRENQDKDRVTLGNIQAKGYASPEGPTDFNDKLAKNRSNTGKDAVSKQMKGVNVGYDVAAYGEDWDGFKALVESSNMPDKDLILQVLNMYSSPVQREKEIKNMAAVYSVLKKDILPQLRRTKMIASADIEGKTDAELRAAVKNPGSLNNEELLYAATLFEDNATKGMLYKTAAEKYNDARAYNNLGVVLLNDGDVRQAKAAFQKAASLSNSPEVSNNLGVVALTEGDIQGAKRYLQPLNSADAAGNKALVSAVEGNVAGATRDLQGYNLAVVELANGNVARAKSLLGNDRSANADYVRAVIAMREGDSNGAMTNLKTAASKDKSLAAKAKKDIEFSKLFGNADFRAL